MAAAYDALVSLMNTIEQIKNHALISTFFFKEQLESVGQRVEFLLDFIEKYSSHGANDVLEKRIASAANEAEGVIESHIMDQIRADKRSSSILLADLQKIIEEMDCIKEETIKVQEERRSEDEQQPAFSIPAAATSWRAHQTRMVGFDEESSQLMDGLTREESSLQIISVVGMGGIGKSTLVRNIYENFMTVRRFDVCAWALVTQKYSVRGILIDLLLSFKQKATSETVHELGEMLYKFLFSRRYLIVLDDVWSVEVWDEIQLYFPENNNDSRIVLTTRLLNVGINICNSYCLIRMNILDEDESWVLFRETVFGGEDSPPELEEVGKEISKQCKGLPLSIVVVGGLLRRSNKTVESWKNVAKNITSVLISSDEDDDCYKILSLSYSQLDVHLKPCFVCMGIFPEGREIRASQIIKVWVAGGFIKPNGTQTLEEIAKRYLNELIYRNLILVYRDSYDGKIVYLVHDLIRDVCKRKFEEDGLFCVGRSLGIEREPRIISHEFMPSDNTLAAFLLFVRSSYVWFALIVLLRKLPLHVMYRLLRVLNMADSSLESIFKNLNLRFLTYQPSDTYKSSTVLIPSSVSLIWNLQTLAIHSNGHKLDLLFLAVAPLKIWNLQQLRHVQCYKIYIPDPPPNVVLKNLQTLTTVVNLRLSEEVCKRIPNVNKLYLKYDCNVPGFDHCWCDHLHNLGSLHKLRSLKLLSNPISFLNPQSSFRAGWHKCTFPTSLKKLKLIGCLIDWNDLTRISSLPHLEVLKLHDSMKGHNWSPADGEFRALKVLSIVNCDLRCWNADSSHFPVLEKLFLEELRHLEEIPLDIGEIPTLELISVYGCSNSAQISAEEIKKQQENQGNDGLQIQISTPSSFIHNIIPASYISRDRLAFRGSWELHCIVTGFYIALTQMFAAQLQFPCNILCILLSSIVFWIIIDVFF